MSIGLYDSDFQYGTAFNLDLMKIASYYKSKKEMVIMSPGYTPERHQQFFVSKDYDDGIYFPFRENVQFRGRQYGDKIAPLPLEIELAQPDTTIYEKKGIWVPKNKIGFDTRSTIYEINLSDFEKLQTYNHVRISRDGATVWQDWEKQIFNPKGSLLLHDYDLAAIEGGFETIRDYSTNFLRYQIIGWKFPIESNDPYTLLKWSGLKVRAPYNYMIYNEKLAPTEKSFLHYY